MERITSRSNPLLAHIRRLLSDKAYRRKAGELVCEGPKLLEEALKNGILPRLLIQAEGAKELPALPETVRRVSVPEDLFSWLSDTKTPQKLLFSCSIPAHSLPEPLPPGHYLVLDGIQDPGNLGTIWRTADAFGAAGMLLLPGCADPWGPKALRAGMGVSFRLPVWETEPTRLPELLEPSGLPLYAAALTEGAVMLGETALYQAAVVIGSEGRGVSPAVLSLCQKTLKIPMAARCESLNAAVAAAVILWEMQKETTARSG